MTNNIFKNNAQKYWDHKLPVVPVEVKGKKPLVKNWYTYHDKMPTVDTQQEWLEKYPDANIGLVLGEQSNLVFLDIDNTFIRKWLDRNIPIPYSACERYCNSFGGSVAFRFNGEQKTKSIVFEGGSPLHDLLDSKPYEAAVELFGAGSLVVVPPSVHPNGKPYMWVGEPVWSSNTIPKLPDDYMEKASLVLKELNKRLK